MPPEQTPTPQAEPFNFLETNPKKNFAPWFLIFCAVLIIVGLVLAGYLKYQNYKNHEQELLAVNQTEESLADTSTWQVYRSEKHGFEFRYPPEWNSIATSSDKGQIEWIKFGEDKNGNFQGVFYVKVFPTESNYLMEENIIAANSTKSEIEVGSLKASFYGDFIVPTATLKKNALYLQFGAPFESGKVLLKVLSTFKFIEPSTQTSGTLTGQVNIGPNCPVEREGVTCPTSPEAYAAREFLVLNKDKKQVASFHANAQGNFNLTLTPGTYTIVSAKTGMGFMSGSLPKTIEIKSGQIVTLNIDVDTGIR